MTEDGPNRIEKTEKEWRRQLGFWRYRIMRRHGTEQPYSSPLHAEDRPGLYRCAGCGAVTFSSAAKFDSGTGWPSFFAPAASEAVATRQDRFMFNTRTEVHCATCGGHLGHVFDDGPRPTYRRYCINGLSLEFEPQE